MLYSYLFKVKYFLFIGRSRIFKASIRESIIYITALNNTCVSVYVCTIDKPKEINEPQKYKNLLKLLRFTVLFPNDVFRVFVNGRRRESLNIQINSQHSWISVIYIFGVAAHARVSFSMTQMS